MTFKGFPKNAFDFFLNLEKNNNRDWFQENKNEYETKIKTPAMELVDSLAPRFGSENLPYICNPKKAVFRLNRDVRFSKNKDPYKTNLGVYFPYNPYNAAEKVEASAGLYFHYSSNERFIGGGMYAPMPPELKSIRNYILERHFELEDIIEDDLFKKVFPNGLTGESLKKTPLGFPKEHTADKFLKMKSFLVGFDYKEEIVYKDELVDILFLAGKAMAPFLDFLFRAKSGMKA